MPPCHRTHTRLVPDSLILNSILQMPQKVLEMRTRVKFVFHLSSSFIPLLRALHCVSVRSAKEGKGPGLSCLVPAVLSQHPNFKSLHCSETGCLPARMAWFEPWRKKQFNLKMISVRCLQLRSQWYITFGASSSDCLWSDDIDSGVPLPLFTSLSAPYNCPCLLIRSYLIM